MTPLSWISRQCPSCDEDKIKWRPNLYSFLLKKKRDWEKKPEEAKKSGRVRRGDACEGV